MQPPFNSDKNHNYIMLNFKCEPIITTTIGSLYMDGPTMGHVGSSDPTFSKFFVTAVA